LLGTLLGFRYLNSGGTNPFSEQIPEVDWSNRERTVVLALSTSCRFCSANAIFYTELIEAVSKDQRLRVIAIFQEGEERGREYLKSLGIHLKDVYQAKFRKLNIREVPSVVTINSSGEVISSQAGYLKREDQIELLSKVTGKSMEEIRRPSLMNIGDVAAALKRREPLTLLNVDNREEFKRFQIERAKHIPADEIATRALDELDPSHRIVLYTGTDHPARLDFVLNILRMKGFSQVFILNGGYASWKNSDSAMSTS
jgi:rhodanese-related sulfurtransferase